MSEHGQQHGKHGEHGQRRRDVRDHGATAVEYSLILTAIAAVVVAVVYGLGALTKDQLSTTSECVAAGIAATC